MNKKEILEELNKELNPNGDNFIIYDALIDENGKPYFLFAGNKELFVTKPYLINRR